MTNKEIFIEICKQEIKREGIDNLLSWLEKSDFYIAPASTKYHGSYEGGLLEHSLNVYKQLKSLVSIYNLNVSEESIAIVALFHDICKTNFYKKSYRNAKDEITGKWVQKETYEIEDSMPFGYHADKSVIILQSFLSLKENEIYAIRAHMGAFDTAYKGGDYTIGKIFEKSNLAVLTHLADMIATYLIENKQ